MAYMKVDKAGDNIYTVQSDPKKPSYTVKLDDAGKWTCECAAYQFGGGKACKHIDAVHQDDEPVGGLSD